MDKQQALKSWMEKTFPKGCNKVSVLKGRRSFEAGWEAREDLLSSTDAVVGGVSVLIDALDRIANNTAHPCSEEQAYSWIETARGIAGEALKEFNPLGAAPQAEPTHTEALKHAKETLQWMFDNMTADDKRDVQDSHDRPLNAIHAIELALQSASTPPAAGLVLTKELFNELINAGRDMASRDRLGNVYLAPDDYYKQICERTAQ